MEDSKRTVAVCIVIALALFVGAYFAPLYWQTILIGLGTVLLGFVVPFLMRRYRKHLERPILYVTLASLLIAMLTGLAVYFAFRYYLVTRTDAFPNPDGTIADFTSGIGGPAVTNLGTQCSLMSDSVYNRGSLISYARIDDRNVGDGFLRVSYTFTGQQPGQPYAGIYCPFSTPPDISYDVSMFRGLSFRIRLDRPQGDHPVAVWVTLYSPRLPDFARRAYAFPTFEIPSGELTTDWQEKTVHFDEFGHPSYMKADIALDPTSVYQIGFMISGTPQVAQSGSVDIDDIRFTK